MAKPKKHAAGAASSPRAGKSKSAEDAGKDSSQGGRTRAGYRETVESICVAIILALLFRAFVAEAFVIPTGSMAPTLMGAHKDLECGQCGSDYRVGASIENKASPQRTTVVASVCPNCRHVNTLDLQDEPNDTTFSGDRILVSKFAYALQDPNRWDVIVFKYPGNPKQNYIKRLVGLPNETIRLQHGDVFSRPEASERFTIARKAPAKLMAMSHRVYDSQFQAPLLLEQDYPSRLQPWAPQATAPPEDSWQIERTADGLTATLAGQAEPQWLRYFHRWPEDTDWERAAAGESLADIDPYGARAITDFYAYDSYLTVPSQQVYERPPGVFPVPGSRDSTWLTRRYGLSPVFRPGYAPEEGVAPFMNARSFRSEADYRRDGMHWVGDLISEFDVETDAAAESLILEIVEAGVQYQCHLDLTAGTAALRIEDFEDRSFDPAVEGEPAGIPTAETGVHAGERHQLRFTNADDRLVLWVDGDVVPFDRPTTFTAAAFRPVDENYPRYTVGHPLDAAPVGIAARGGQATVHRAQVLRDQYYIATEQQQAMIDYDLFGFDITTMRDILSDPTRWDAEDGRLWNSRRVVEFSLGDDQFFPMGDNSPESKDARCWVDPRQSPQAPDEDAYMFAEVHYVPRNLLVGKAIFIFWPHPWKRPIPFLPNVQRMGLIR